MIILAVRYEEPQWLKTRACIEATGLPVHYVHRNPKGVGSLSEAINRGMREINTNGLVWVVTNVTFTPETPLMLAAKMDDYAILHPAFESDHRFCRPDGSGTDKPVPFVEFTAPMIKGETFQPLDEKMPYWGMDLDYCYRMWESGHRVGVHHGTTLGHDYIRKTTKFSPITAKRRAMRYQTNEATKTRLRVKYGTDWRDSIFPKTEEQANEYLKRYGY